MLRDLAIITLGLSYIVNIALSITVVGPDPASLMPACLRWLCAGHDLFLVVGPSPSYFWPRSGIFLVLVQFHVVDQVQRLWVLRPSVAKVLDQVQALKFDRVQKLTRPRPAPIKTSTKYRHDHVQQLLRSYSGARNPNTLFQKASGPGPSYFWPWSGIFLALVQFHVVDQVQWLWVLRPSAAKVLDQVQPSHYQICNYLQRPDS